MDCRSCGTGNKTEIAAKTLRHSAGVTRCHRLECGHAWHVATTTNDPSSSPEPVQCTCREITTVNMLLAEGRSHEVLGNDLSPEAFASWLAQVLRALDGIPAESGAPSLVRSATTVAKSQTSALSKKITELNKLLTRAIKAVS